MVIWGGEGGASAYISVKVSALVRAYLLSSADLAGDPFQDEVKVGPVSGLIVLQGYLASHGPVWQRTTVSVDPLGLQDNRNHTIGKKKN